MNQYAYRIYKTAPNNPVIGGTVTGESMEQAIQQVIKRNNVNVVHEFHHGCRHDYFMHRGIRVGILLYANPEQF